MPCDDCSRTESCPPCPDEQEGPIRPSLTCMCGHKRSAHAGHGRCYDHDMATMCTCPAFVCDHTRCGWKPRGDKPAQCDHPDNDPCDRCLPGKPEPRCEGCGHTEGEGCGCPPKCTCGCPRGAHMGMPQGCIPHGFHLYEVAEEPPMTPEEEEQAPEDEECVCGEPDAQGTVHRTDGPCYVQAPSPPQPERRPPCAVVYSVGGHLYEVAVSGDAAVRAVDGALVITHDLGPVAGIVQTAPLINEESA